MNKYIGGLIAALMLFGACGESSQQVDVGVVDIEKVDPAGQEIVFWYQHTRMREEAMLALIERFNSSNAHGIKVKGEYAGNYSDIYNKMLVGLQGGSLPNLVVAYQNMALAYHEADGVVDLTPYMSSVKWGLAERDDFIQSFLAQDNIDGVQIALPPNRSMEIIYYNVDWLKELGYDAPPRTWEEFGQMCLKAKAQPFSGSENKERSLGLLIDPDASRMASMVFSRGGEFMQDGRFTFNTPQGREALGQMRQLAQDGAVEVLSEDHGDTREFAIGSVLFILDSTSGLPFVQSAVESGLGFAWDVAPPPYKGEKPVVNVYGASVAVCRATPQKQLASWIFMDWLTRPEQQAEWVRASNYFPVRRSTAANLKDYFAKNPRYEKAFGLLDYGKSEPSVAGYEPVRRMAAQVLVDVLQGDEVEKALAELEKDANQALADR
jgi:multiple sugar transport system substrate-binding protein